MTSRKALCTVHCLIVAAVWLALPSIPGMCASTDAFRAASPGPGVLVIQGKWQFHVGDDPAWAAPSLDDGGWEQLDADDTWGDQTHPGYTGFAWYRKHIQMAGRGARIAVLIPPVEDAYEVYWNGRKVGECGKLPPHGWWWLHPRGAVYLLENAPLDGVLALRVWKAPLKWDEGWWAGGLSAAPLIGSPAMLTQRVQFMQTKMEDLMIPRFMLGGALFITGIIAVVLFLRERRNLIYLWLGLLFIANFLECLEGTNPVNLGLTNFLGKAFYHVALSLQHISLWMLLLTLFGWHSRRTWRVWTVAVIALHLSALAVNISLKPFWEAAGPVMQATDMLSAAIMALTPIYTLVIVIAGVRKGLSRGLIPMVVTVTLYDCYNLAARSSLVGIRYTHLFLPWDQLNPGFPLGPYLYGIPAILNTLMFLVLLYTVAHERSREMRRQAHVENEIASAHEVQDVLIPTDLPAIPGFTISSVYKPATEVGGDFYQVIPLRDEDGEACALILLGDVSGKGLKAAMTVSLIVGTVRALAEFTCDPADILTRLNGRLMGRTRGGFATCVALRMERGGRTVIASAGHLAPFCAGREINLPGSLPLGLAADVLYESTTLHLEPGETLTLMTDGVLEARGPNGELYGYGRLSELMQALPTVQEIVDTACSFGQDDDITVLSVTRIADAERSDARLHLVAQIAAAG